MARLLRRRAGLGSRACLPKYEGVVLFVLVLLAASATLSAQPALSKDQIREFLLAADVIAAEQTGTGTTHTFSQSIATRDHAGSATGWNGTSLTRIATTSRPTDWPSWWVSAT